MSRMLSRVLLLAGLCASALVHAAPDGGPGGDGLGRDRPSRDRPGTDVASPNVASPGIASPDIASTTGPRTARLDGVTLTLVEHQGQCAMRRDDGAVTPLAVGWPCAFSADKSGATRVERFNGIPIVLATRVLHEPAPSRDCHATQQAVRLLKNGKLEASDLSQTAGCWANGHDQKMYVGLFNW